jgi:hypothetical protein
MGYELPLSEKAFPECYEAKRPPPQISQPQAPIWKSNSHLHYGMPLKRTQPKSNEMGRKLRCANVES